MSRRGDMSGYGQPCRASLVIMGFHRRENLRRILTWAEESERISEVLLLLNGGGLPDGQFSKMVYLQAGKSLPLDARFSVALMASEPTVFMLDDDILPDDRLAGMLIDGANAEPERLHGFWGREPWPGGHYAQVFNGRQGAFDVDMVLCGCCAFRRELAAGFYLYRERPGIIRARAAVRGLNTNPCNGEDIIFAYSTGRKGRIHAGWPVCLPEELDTGAPATSKQPDHDKARQIILRACLEAQSKP